MKLHNKPLDIYFYNGFEQPELLGTSIQNFIDNEVRITQGFGLLNVEVDDLTELVIEQLEDYLNRMIYTDELEFGIFVDPTLEDFMEENERRGLRPMTHLSNLETSGILSKNKERVCAARFEGYKMRNPEFDATLA